tara:strand:+ start:2303 stop:3055 length:753 start_codon:yes stop_codon:yes gene_type:complete
MPKDFNTFIKEAEDKAPTPEAPAETELTPDSAEIALDPRLEKEVFIDSFEINGKRVVIKSLGLGPTKPVVVYIDDKRWEVFPGPRIAKREVRRHIKKSPKYATGGEKFYKIENIDNVFESFLAEANLHNQSEVRKWIQKNKRKFDNSTEAAFAVADEFGMEDELEDEKHWLWKELKRVYKESKDFDLDLYIEKLIDGTKISIDEDTAKKVMLVYEHLDDDNKARFREAFIINKENHNKVMKFVEQQTKGI